MRFKPEFAPSESSLRRVALERGYEIAGGTLAIGGSGGGQEWRFVALALSRKSGAPLSVLSAELAAFEGIDSFQISHARN
jgi:putative Mg2+ transporter-C (MgtC) family protein